MSACSDSGSWQHLGGERRVQVGHHQRDRLRRLVAQEGDDLLGRRAAQELERAALDDTRQAADDLERSAAEGALEHVAGVVDAAEQRGLLGLDGGGELLEDVVADVRTDVLELGHVERQGLDLLVAHVLDHLGGVLGAEGGHQHRRLAPARMRALVRAAGPRAPRRLAARGPSGCPRSRRRGCVRDGSGRGQPRDRVLILSPPASRCAAAGRRGRGLLREMLDLALGGLAAHTLPLHGTGSWSPSGSRSRSSSRGAVLQLAQPDRLVVALLALALRSKRVMKNRKSSEARPMTAYLA